MYSKLNLVLLIGASIIWWEISSAQQIDQLPYGYLCYLSRMDDCLGRVPSLPFEWNITDPMEYCKEQTRPRDPLTGELCEYDDPNCGPELCPIPPLQFQNIFEPDYGPQESVIVRRVTDRRYPFPVFLIKWLPVEGVSFYVVKQWSHQIPTPYYSETKHSFITVPSWGSCTLNFMRVAAVVDSRFHFFSATAAIYDEPRFPSETQARFEFMEAVFSNDTVNNDFLPVNEERVVYVRASFRLGVMTSVYDIAQIGDATMFSPNCRLDYISLYPRPMKLAGAREFLFSFPEAYAARNCTIAVKIHNVVTRCNQTISITNNDPQQQPGSSVYRARQRLGIVPPPFLMDRLQAVRQLRFRLDCDKVKNYDCRRAAELLSPSCGVTNVDVLPDPEPGTYWLLWGPLLRPTNLPVRAWVIMLRHTHSNDTMRFVVPTSDNTAPDYGHEFRPDRRLKIEFGASRTSYRVQVCAVYDNNYDETQMDYSRSPDRVIQLFDEISEGVAHPRPSPVLAIEPIDENVAYGEVAVTRMEIVRRALSDRMIVALAIAVALAVSLAVCVPFVLCSAARKRHEQLFNVKLGSVIEEPAKTMEVGKAMVKLSPIPVQKSADDKY